jgi:pyroglutamyl-peptidase
MADGPARIGVSLPTRRILWSLRSRGIPAKLSMDCGGYICNAVLYHALAFTRATGRSRRLGFVHVPKTLAIGHHRVIDVPSSNLSARDAIAAGLELLTVTHRAGPARSRD